MQTTSRVYFFHTTFYTAFTHELSTHGLAKIAHPLASG